jgi:hypothetical protein
MKTFEVRALACDGGIAVYLEHGVAVRATFGTDYLCPELFDDIETETGREISHATFGDEGVGTCHLRERSEAQKIPMRERPGMLRLRR